MNSNSVMQPTALISAAQQIDPLSKRSSSSQSVETTELIRRILKGIQNVMLYNAKKSNHTKNGTSNMDDDRLKEECLLSTKIKQEYNEFEFEEYAHVIFDLLRIQFDLKAFKYLYKLFGIKQLDTNKVDVEYASKHFWKSLLTNSASTQLFYRSKDNLFIIKEVQQNEWHLLRHSFLFNYFKHMQANKDSLLTKILGLYRINNIYFIVMKNIYHAPLKPLTMHKVYDLKGSTHKRQATRHKLVLDTHDIAALTVIQSTSSFCDLHDIKYNDDEHVQETMDNIKHAYSPSLYHPTAHDDLSKIKILRLDSFDANDDNVQKRKWTKKKSMDRKNSENIEVWKRSKILKDLDWIQDTQMIKVGKIRSSFFLQQFQKDLSFLTKMKVMDYSLLVGINYRNDIHVNKSKHNKDDQWIIGKLFAYENGGMCYDGSGEKDNAKIYLKPQKDPIYFCGIIDFLQVYSAKRKMETLVKCIAHDKNEISVIDPESYAKRLYSLVQKSVE